MKIAIIGAGFSGLAIAWHLLNRSPPLPALSIHLFDEKEIGRGVSGIAAGLLHPYSGAHAKLNWRGIEGIEATNKLIEAASRALGRPVFAKNNGILRLVLKNEQLTDFKKCAEFYPEDVEWLDPRACQHLAPGCAEVPGLWIKNGLTLYSSLYLQGLFLACTKLGMQFKKRIISSMGELENYDLTIAATGAESLQLPELADLPIKRVKGQILEFSWPRNRAPLGCSLNSQIYLLMNETRTSCLVGATYEKGEVTDTVDISIAEKEILPKAYALFPPLKEASLLNCYAGIRAVGPNHRPLMKQISPSQWVLTGMGSKGLLYHALFAEELVNQL